MDAPSELRTAADERDDVVVTRREYPAETVVAVDFGAGVEATLDVVDGTAIVVAGDRQFEFAVPEGATEMTTNGGMLLIHEETGDGTAPDGGGTTDSG